VHVLGDFKVVICNVGLGVSLREELYALAHLKYTSKQKDLNVDQNCKWKAKKSLAPGNSHPGSWHMVKRILGVPSPAEYEHHVCINDCCRFPSLPLGENLMHFPCIFLSALNASGDHAGKYEGHEKDACPVCKELRFETKKTAAKVQLVPRKVFWYFGIESVIRDRMFGDKQWSSLRGKGRQEPLQYYTSSEAKRVNLAVGGQLFHVDNSAYELGLDWGQVFINKTHSTGVVAIR
jgi:hypothetical protein